MPQQFRRSRFRKAGKEERVASAIENLERMRTHLGLDDFVGISLLDIGCADRFTVALLNRDIPVAAYHGVDVSREIIEHLSANVSDPRFSYTHIDVQNDMYNPKGEPLSADTDIGAKGRRFDIVCLFSVFTHLAPHDWKAMLELNRRHVADGGNLIFSAFVDPAQDEDFIDTDERHPLVKAFYSETALEKFCQEAGWTIDKMFDVETDNKRWVFCSPA